MSNRTETVTEVVPVTPVKSWFVQTDWQVDVSWPEETRSSDGRYLRVNVSLNQAEFAQSAANVQMADAFGVAADCLFIGTKVLSKKNRR